MKRFAIAAITAGLFAPTADAHYYPGCQKRACKRHVIGPYNSHLESIARCESGRRWHLNTGLFDGGLQFSAATWRATGSRFAYAYQASALEQKYRAVVWAAKIKWAWHTPAGWPVCG